MIFIIIAIFLGLILLSVGYLVGKITQDYVGRRQKPLTLDEMDRIYQRANAINTQVVQNEENPAAEKISQKEDILSDGVGIVYRPTAEELEKMKEPESVRLAKEAVAETLRKQEEIDKSTL